MKKLKTKRGAMKTKFDTCLQFTEVDPARKVARSYCNTCIFQKKIFLPKSKYANDEGYVWVVASGDKYLRINGKFE